MKRSMIVMFALGLLIAWSSMAMANDTALVRAAANHCPDWGVTTDTNIIAEHQAIAIPYLPDATAGRWGGFAITNTNNQNPVRPGEICIVGVKNNGATVGQIYNRQIPAHGIAVFTLEGLTQPGSDWEDRNLMVGVFVRNSADPEPLRDALRGFFLLGDGRMAQGDAAYDRSNSRFEDRTGIRTSTFNYTPGDEFGWWRAFSVFNNGRAEDQDQYVAVKVFQNNNIIAWGVHHLPAMRGLGKQLGGNQDPWVTNAETEFDSSLDARVIFASFNTRTAATNWASDPNQDTGQIIYNDAQGQNVLMTFGFYGDGMQGYGTMGNERYFNLP